MLDKSVIIVLTVILAAILVVYHKNALQDASEAARSSVVQKYEATYVEGLKTSLNASNELLIKSNKAKEELEREKADIAKRHSAIVAGLQNRATRAESANRPNPTASPVAPCTGAELPREDAEFLAGEAARAERVLKERDDYYKAYERARTALETLQREPG